MRRSIKFTLTGLVLIGIVGALPFAADPIVRRIGDGSIQQLARDGNFCKSDQCSEGYDYVIGFLETNYQLAPDDVRWCMGVDVIAHQNWWLADGLKNSVTERMYKRCGDPALDKPLDAPSE